MIDKWNILHLEKRKDRAPFAFGNAERLGVPREKVGFWYAKDADVYSGTDAMIDAIVADGFPEFEGVRSGQKWPPGKTCQVWNVCRFLRDLADRDSIEMLIHDGVMVWKIVNEKTYFYPDFQFFCDMVGICQSEPDPFKMLVVGTLIPFMELQPLRADSFILRGVHATVNSIRVYSSLGAQSVLKRTLSEVEKGNCHADLIFNDSTFPLSNIAVYSEPGMYTLMMQKLAADMDPQYFGSDSMGWESYRGKYKAFFGES